VGHDFGAAVRFEEEALEQVRIKYEKGVPSVSGS
jgi:hypothetical protein